MRIRGIASPVARMLAIVWLTQSIVSLSFAEEPAASPPRKPSLDLIKKLAGEWVRVDEQGQRTEEVVTSFRVTAGGSAVIETLFAGTDHEMITMYCQEGDDLLLTHYCVLGNHPRMKCHAGKEAGQWVFQCQEGGTLKCHEEAHMHRGELTVVSADRIKTRWTMLQDGQPGEQVAMDLARKRP